MIGFERRNGELLCDGVSLADAARAHGTPLYVYSRRRIEAAFDAYAHAFAGVSHRVCYALKANASGAILKALAAKGAGADVVSGMELRAALRAGFPPERIVFAGVGKTDDELRLGLDHAIGSFNAESEVEIVRLSALAAARGVEARVALRVNPDVDPRSHPHISTGLRTNKFGIDIGQAAEVLERAHGLPGIEVVGLHCHIGSQIRDLDPLEEAARELVALSRRLLERGFPLTEIDLGGGLGVDAENGAPGPDALARRVLPHLRDLPLRLLLEPGRSLVAAAGGLLARVILVKRTGAKTFVIVDAGMNDLIRPALYDAQHRIEPVLAHGRAIERVDVVGPVCESGDFLARDRDLETVEPGDLLLVRDAGAYGFAMSSNYNLRPRPAEIMVEGGVARLVRRRETFEDLVGTEVE